MATGIRFTDLDEWKSKTGTKKIVGQVVSYGVTNNPFKDTLTGEPFTYIDYWQNLPESPGWKYYTSGYLQWNENLTEVFEMYVYNIILVNTEECEVVQRYENVVAESEKLAMLEIALSLEAKTLHKKGKIKFIFNQVGGFDRFKKSEE